MIHEKPRLSMIFHDALLHDATLQPPCQKPSIITRYPFMCAIVCAAQGS